MFAILFEVLLIQIQEESISLQFGRGRGTGENRMGVCDICVARGCAHPRHTDETHAFPETTSLRGGVDDRVAARVAGHRIEKPQNFNRQPAEGISPPPPQKKIIYMYIHLHIHIHLHTYICAICACNLHIVFLVVFLQLGLQQLGLPVPKENGWEGCWEERCGNSGCWREGPTSAPAEGQQQ